MKKCGVLLAVVVAPALMAASPDALNAQEESPFLLQDHGGVRVIRGLDSGKNFEAATLPQEIEMAPAAVPEAQAEPPTTRPRAEPRLTTRQRALRRVRERGIPVIRAGETRVRPPTTDSTRSRAIERSRQRGAPVNRAG